ncbi:MAG: O-antigen polymerase, partial [Candidatus Berkelbacteria bacterium Gr01-1014_85]
MLELINPLNLSLVAIGLVVAYWLARWIAPDPSRGIYLIAFFLPFERIPSLELAGFTFKINHFLGILTFVLWLGALLVAKHKLMPHPFTWLIVSLFFSFIISGLGAENSFRQLTVMISLGLMAVLHFVTVGNIRKSEDLKIISRLILISAGLMSLIGLYQFFGDLAGLPLGV